MTKAPRSHKAKTETKADAEDAQNGSTKVKVEPKIDKPTKAELEPKSQEAHVKDELSNTFSDSSSTYPGTKQRKRADWDKGFTAPPVDSMLRSASLDPSS